MHPYRKSIYTKGRVLLQGIEPDCPIPVTGSSKQSSSATVEGLSCLKAEAATTVLINQASTLTVLGQHTSSGTAPSPDSIRSHQTKRLLLRSYNLSPVPRTHKKVEGARTDYKVILWLPHISTACASQPHTHDNKDNKYMYFPYLKDMPLCSFKVNGL